MEDDKLRSLFAEFSPEIPDDTDFMRELERNLDSVEMIRRKTQEDRRRSRIAVALAAIAGFVAGFLLSLGLPYFSGLMSKVNLSVSLHIPVDMWSYGVMIFGWLIVACASGIIAMNTYDLSLSVMTLRQRQEY
ncbi:MAG: hypothetical protein K2H35_02520 [Muribaculaceae bacterium]|nr:hypothetical protein [Muribaculaceae bacterium]MDE6559517.1 hypothetical protein [Muribaculaceae bacterium]